MSTETEGLIEIDPRTVAQWLANGEALAVDVREDEEWEEERIDVDGVLLSPMSDFEADEFPLAQDGQKLVLICRVGQRSAAIGRKLLQLGKVAEVYNMTGGVNGWLVAKLPVIREEDLAA